MTHRMLAALGLAALLAPFAQADFFSDPAIPVAERAGARLVYELYTPSNTPQWSTAGRPVPYAIDNSAFIAASSYSRIGYYVEVLSSPTAGQPGKWVYVSFDTAGVTGTGPALTTASSIGLPHNPNNAINRQQLVLNSNIYSNLGTITTGTAIGTVNLEMWPSNYGGAAGAVVPGGTNNFDYDDTGFGTGAGHGSFQIHNYGAAETLFGLNRWGGGNQTGLIELGVGNAPGANTDWTFANNGATGRIQIIVNGASEKILTTGGDWSTGGNWTGGTEPTATDYAYVGGGLTGTVSTAGRVAEALIVGHNQGTSPGTGTLNLNAPGTLAVTGSVFLGEGGNNGAINLTGGGTLTFGGGIASFATDSISDGTLSLPTQRSIDVANSLTISSTISGAGGITKGGAGTLALTGSLAYTGNTNIIGGTMTYNGTSTLSGASAFNIGNGSGTSGAFTLTGGSLTIDTSGASNATGPGNVNGLRVGNGNQSVGVLNVTGGTLTVGGANASEFLVGYSTTTTATAASGTVNVSGGTLNVGVGGGRVFIGGGNSGAANGVGVVNISGTGVVNVAAPGAFPNDQMYLSGFGGSGIVNLNAGGTLAMARNIKHGSGGGPSTLNFNGGTLKANADFSVNSDLTAANVLASGAIFDSNGFTLTFNEPLLNGGGGGGVTKNGAGTLELTGASTYTGGTTISRGTVVGVSNTAFGTGTITLGNASTGANDVAVSLRSSVDIANPVTVSASGSGLAIIGTDGAGVAGNATTYSGLITLNRATTFRSTVTDRLAIDGRITGSVGTLTVDGGSRTTFLSTLNDFVGNVSISGAGTILQASVGTAGEVIPNASSVNVGASATFQLAGSAGSTETINALTGSGTVTRNVAGLQTLVVGSAGGGGTFSGVIQNGSGTVALTKTGTGTQTLSGNNSYSGGTTITAGTLAVTHSNALGTGTVTMNGGTLNTSVNLANNFTLNATANVIAPNGNYRLLSGQISGLGGFTVANGGGTPGLELNNPLNNFQGNVTINAGTFLRLTASEVLPNAISVANNGNLRMDVPGGGSETIAGLTGTGSVWVPIGNNNVQTLIVGFNNTSSQYDGKLGNVGQNNAFLALNKIGNGTLTLTGANLYSAGTVVAGGTLSVADMDDAGGDSNIGTGFLALSNGTLRYTGAGINTTARNLFVDVSPGTFDIQNAAGELRFTGGGNLTQTITKTGPGTLRLDNTVAITSPVNLSQGTLQVGTNMSTGAISINDTGTGANTTALLAIEPVTISNNITVNNFGAGTTLGTTNFVTGANTAFTGTLTLAKDVTLQAGSSDRTTFSGQITGTGNILVTSPFAANRRIVFERTAGPANNFVGDVTLGASADLQLGVANSLGNRTLPDATNVMFNLGSRLRLAPAGSGDGETMGALQSLAAGAGQVDMFTGTAFTLTVGGGNNSGNFSGTIINSAGSLALTKTGTGTQELSGALANTYTGITTVNDGVLKISKNGALGTAAGNTVVGNLASLEIAGGLAYGTAEPLELNGAGFGGPNTGAFFIADGGSSSFAGPIDIASNATIGAFNGSTLTLTGQINKDATTLTFLGNGSTGPGANTVNINGGIVGPTPPNSDLVVDNMVVNVNSVIDYAGPTFVRNSGIANITSIGDATTTAITLGDSGTGTVNQAAGSSVLVNGGVGVGNLLINNGSDYNLLGGSLDFDDTSGATGHHAGGTASEINIVAGGTFNFNGGSLYDVTTIQTNGGTFTQSSGNFYIGEDEADLDNTDNFARKTTIDGNFLMLSGVLHIDIFGPEATPLDMSDGEPIDLLDVNGIADLNGLIDLDFENGFEPAFGDIFSLVKADDIVLGDNFGLSNGFVRVIEDGMGGFVLQAIVPEPGTVAMWSLLALAAGGFAARMRGRRRG